MKNSLRSVLGLVALLSYSFATASGNEGKEFDLKQPVSQIRLSPGNEWIAAITLDGHLKVANRKTGSILFAKEYPAYYPSGARIEFSSNQKFLFVRYATPKDYSARAHPFQAHMLSTAGWTEPFKNVCGADHFANRMALTTDQRHLIVLCESTQEKPGKLRVMRMSDQAFVFEQSLKDGEFFADSRTSDEDNLLLPEKASNYAWIRIYTKRPLVNPKLGVLDLHSSPMKWTVTKASDLPDQNLIPVLSPDGSRLAVPNYSRNLEVWDSKTAMQLASIPLPHGAPNIEQLSNSDIFRPNARFYGTNGDLLQLTYQRSSWEWSYEEDSVTISYNLDTLQSTGFYTTNFRVHPTPDFRNCFGWTIKDVYTDSGLLLRLNSIGLVKVFDAATGAEKNTLSIWDGNCMAVSFSNFYGSWDYGSNRNPNFLMTWKIHKEPAYSATVIDLRRGKIAGTLNTRYPIDEAVISTDGKHKVFSSGKRVFW